MKVLKKLLLTISFSFALVFVMPTFAHAGSFASVNFTFHYRTISGVTYDMKGTSVYARSSKDNNYKWVHASYGCQGCRTCSVKGGSPSGCDGGLTGFGAAKTLYSDSYGQAYFTNTFACGSSTCSGTDYGTCNPFKFSVSAPSGRRYGHWQGITSNGDKNFDVNISVTNGGTVSKSYTYQEVNRIGTLSYNLPPNGATFPIPDGQNVSNVTMSGKLTDPDGDKVAIQIMYKKTKDSANNTVNDKWHSFGSNSAENPNGANDSQPVTYSSSSKVPNVVPLSTRPSDLNPYGWKHYNGGPTSTEGSVIVFPTVYLDAGTYTWAIRGTDPYNYVPWITGRTFKVTYNGNPLNVDIIGDGAGSVLDDKGKIACNYSGTGDATGDCSELFPLSTTQTAHLTAKASAGSQFVGWSNACSGTGGCNPVMSTSRTVVAEFKLIKTMSCAVDPTQGVSPLSIRVRVSTTPSSLASSMKFDYNFGDGTKLLGRGPETYYTYANEGVFPVTVTSNNPDVTSTNCKNVNVEVTAPQDDTGGSRS